MSSNCFDIRITGGTVFDGRGSAPVQADLGIRGDTVADIGDLRGAAAELTIDAAGLWVCPGFIDAHSHSDAFLVIEPSAAGKLCQGITTEIVGNCGASAAPITDLKQLPSDWQDKEYPAPWHTTAEYIRVLESAGPAVNVAVLTGHNTLRRGIVGYEHRHATEQELRRMIRALEQAMDEGSKGLSVGLIYPPGMYAGRSELAALAAVAGSRGGIYAAHMRSEGARLIEAIAETVSIAREAGAAAQVSHLKTANRDSWGLIDEAFGVIRSARAEGLRVGADRYPYCAGATELDVVLPDWVQEGGRDAALERIRSDAQRGRIRRELEEKYPERDWDGVIIGSTWHEANRMFRGMRLTETARRLNTDPVGAILHLALTDELRTGAFFEGMSEANMRRILAEPYVMLGTDASVRAPHGPLSLDHPHPRAYGAFPRFLRMILDERIMSPAEAVRKMTGLPAGQFGLKDRGVIARGMKADVAVIDPVAIRDTATYGSPHQLAEGVRFVVVNGGLSLAQGAFTGRRTGRAL